MRWIIPKHLLSMYPVHGKLLSVAYYAKYWLCGSKPYRSFQEQHIRPCTWIGELDLIRRITRIGGYLVIETPSLGEEVTRVRLGAKAAVEICVKHDAESVHRGDGIVEKRSRPWSVDSIQDFNGVRQPSPWRPVVPREDNDRWRFGS